MQNQKRKIKKIEELLEGYSSFEDDESEEENPHGFVNSEDLGKFRKSKRERRIEEKELKKNEVKEKKYHRKEKGGGESNQEKMKHKPYSMVRPKKQKQASLKNVKQKIKDIKNQLGI